MRTYFIALISAILLAVAVTELTNRLWPDNYLALFIIAAVALVVNGLFNARLAGVSPQGIKPPPARNRQRSDSKGKTRVRADRQDRPQRARNGARDKQGAEHGKVKWFNRSKGYGFIIRGTGEEIFVHQHSINTGNGQRRPTLHDGQAVVFDAVQGDKGMQAENVSPAS
ncbi:MAG: cold shock domain-containing protein [Pseudomonadales bacterium]|mgnify:CR=1 FL=1|jgi:CspA family cold shock protein|nr:cold shock domain-containing protein [Pseudomonadales bacterium]MDP6472039.1 cold shock domain-containing protein [Pseudomonadales bacterium]MDP6826688.1 cold shock domain-containing protein [Pseudomonadales bacterium]MDP6969951.1 cold shock domain-containing protein [Pseudomonadales bacterium]|tara:strand:+ start:131 stop:637 length:507 start_codon:yes stop_codon:yes gene_type:complete